jgi:hypothetical protein
MTFYDNSCLDSHATFRRNEQGERNERNRRQQRAGRGRDDRAVARFKAAIWTRRSSVDDGSASTGTGAK